MKKGIERERNHDRHLNRIIFKFNAQSNFMSNFKNGQKFNFFKLLSRKILRRERVQNLTN